MLLSLDLNLESGPYAGNSSFIRYLQMPSVTNYNELHYSSSVKWPTIPFDHYRAFYQKKWGETGSGLAWDPQ